MVEETEGILLDGSCHGIEHLVSVHLVLYERITVTVSLKADTLTQLLHIVDVIHPLPVYNLQHNHSLQLTKLLGLRELCLFGFIKLGSLLF